MLEILQSLNNGSTELVEAPCPVGQPGCLLVRTRAPVVSAGTERMLA